MAGSPKSFPSTMDEVLVAILDAAALSAGFSQRTNFLPGLHVNDKLSD
jgi:hypothetical protein